MKALSLRQPWADWVVQGKKTLELRTWTVSHRGPLVIHASQTINKEACLAHGIDPASLITGAVIGIVDVVEILELNRDDFTNYQSQHMASGFFNPPEEDEVLFGWKLANARELPAPIPFRGRMGLFNVPATVLEGAAPEKATSSQSEAILEWDERHAFELRVVSNPKKKTSQPSYRLALYQRFIEPPPTQSQMNLGAPVKMRLVAELGGDLLKAVANQILETLRQNGYKATDLSAARREPFYLNEESGVRLGLLFLAIRPLTKLNRVEMISLGLRQMTSEELYYWYSKCTGTANPGRGQKSLRVLLSGE
jgi:hypothetical protein